MQILAISLDLDDTLWPITPIVLRAEQCLNAWLQTHCPPVAAAYPVPAMRALRDRIAQENPHLAHDFTAQRRLSLAAAFDGHGYAQSVLDAAYEAYYAARNQVELYADVLPALQRLSARVPLISLSNGNADLERIGLRHLFAHTLSAREFGMAKPAVEIFHAACARLELAPEQVLHVGDDPMLDVHGARVAGLRSAWVNRHAADWPDTVRADLEFRDLAELADWLELRVAA